MGRKFAAISKEELLKKIETDFSDPDFDDEGFMHHVLEEKLAKDLKVTFDWENYEIGGSHRDLEGLAGVHTLENGLTFVGCWAGGDWEHPVFFLLYWDGKRVRAYIPTDGNPWNTYTYQAYGNNEEKDKLNAQKRYPDLYKEVYDESGEDISDDFDLFMSFEANKIKSDILKRFS